MKAIPYACWHMTFRCNLRCGWCYALKSGREAGRERMLAVADGLAGCCERVSMMGGETLLNPHVVEIARRMHGKCGVSLVTNGTLITPDIVAGLAPLLDRMSVSVDAVEQRVATACRGDAYDVSRVMSGVRTVVRAGVPLKINTLVSSINADHVMEVGLFLESLGCPVDWKLAEPAETAFSVRSEVVPIRLERGDFLEIADELAQRLPTLSIRTSLHDEIEDYVLVTPEGGVYINGTDPLGNVADGDDPAEFLAAHGWNRDGNAELFSGRGASGK